VDVMQEWSSTARYKLMRVESIKPWSLQVRRRYSEDSLSLLAQSIRSNGLIEPIVIRKAQSTYYEIIAGHGRFAAVAMLGWSEIPCIVVNTSDMHSFQMSLIENTQRSDLSPIEIACAVSKLTEMYGMSQSEIGAQIGMQQSSIAHYLSLLRLPAEIQDLVDARRLSMGHAKVLSAISGHKDVIELATRCCEEPLSVRQLEQVVKGMRSDSISEDEEFDQNSGARPSRRTVIEFVGRLYGCLVTDRQRSRCSGRFEIHYCSEAERLEVSRLLERIPIERRKLVDEKE